MKFSPLPIYGGSYADDTKSWSAQDVLGWLPSNAEVPGTKTEGMFKTPPGLRPFAETEVGGGARPVRGAWNAEGKFFVVIGTQLYQLSNAGVFIPIGTIPGTGRVIFSHNQVSLGNQVLAVNGSAGYIYDTRDQTFQRITDPGYPGAFVATFIDGYFVQISANRRFAFNSDVANGLEYNTLDRFTSEFSPDLLVSLVASNNELFLLSETSGEFFENTGAAQQPFRSKRITMDRGCAGAYTVAKADNTVFWLGNNGYFYVLNGYAPQRISTRAIEQSILGKNWKQAFAFAWEDAGHTVIYWTFPDGLTWGYDTSTGLWHRRESYGLNRWRVNTMTFWNQEWYAGDFQYGRVWKMDWDYTLEGDQEFPSERTTAVIHDNQNRIIIPRLELLMQVGQEETIPVEFPEQPDPPTITGDAPDGTLSIPYGGYTYTLTGNAPLTVTLRSGVLPPGLSINSSGVVNTGTPTALGSYPFTLRVTDVNGLWAELEDEITIATLMMAMGRLPPPAAGSNASFIPSANGTDWSANPSAVGVVPDGDIFLIGGTDRFFCFGGAVPSYTIDIGANWVSSVVPVGWTSGGVGVYHKGLFITPGLVDGYYQSVDEAANFTLRAEPTYPRSQYFAENGTRLAVFSTYYNTIHYCDDADAVTPTWLQTAAHGITTNSGLVCFGGDGVIKFTGSIASLPVVKRLNSDGTLTQETLPTFASATQGRAICYMETPDGDKIWVLGTDSGEIAYKVNSDAWILSPDVMSVACEYAATNGAVIVMVADSSGSTDGEIKYSADGVNWTLAPLNTPMSLFSVAALQP